MTFEYNTLVLPAANMYLYLVGDRLLFQARIKFESAADNTTTTCNVYTWDGSTRCSDIFLYTRSGDGIRLYDRVGQIVTDDPDEYGW